MELEHLRHLKNWHRETLQGLLLVYNDFISNQPMQVSSYGNDLLLEAAELRAIIKGEMGFRKCPDCQGEGESWTLHYILKDDPDQSNEQFKEVGAQFAADFDEDNLPQEYSWGECHLYECDTCHSVGYIPVEQW